MIDRIALLAALACLNTYATDVVAAQASVSYTSELSAAVPNASPTLIDSASTDTAAGNFQPVSSFARDYDSGPITNLFGQPTAHALASTFAEVDVPNRLFRFGAAADYVPSGIANLSVGTVTAVGTLDFNDTFTAPDTALPGVFRLTLPITSKVSFQVGAPAGQAIATLNYVVDVSYVHGSNTDFGSASIYDRCTMSGCTTPASQTIDRPDGLTATITPRTDLDGIDIIDVSIPTFGPGQIINLHIGVTASAFTGARIDGRHTGHIQIELPNGEEWTSASGLLAAPVPEPTTSTLVLAGTAVLGWRLRSRTTPTRGHRRV